MDKTKWTAALKIFLLVEFIALTIALIMPFTPSKTGSGKVRLAKYFVEHPTYLHKVLLNVVLVNLIVGVLALIFLAFGYKELRGGGGD